MPRPRINDPVGLTKNRNYVTDPARKAELLAEFDRKLAHISQNYRTAKKLHFAGVEFNQAVRDLKRAVRHGNPEGLSGKRVHPLLEMAITREARRIARERARSEDAEVIGEDVRKASRIIARRAKPVSNRPAENLLRHHFEGAVAVMQEASGMPVLSSRTLDGVYHRRLLPGMSHGLFVFFRSLEPQLPEGRLVTFLEEARRKYVGGWPKFRDFFPMYGAVPGADGLPVLGPGLRLVSFEPNIPTFFH